MSAIRWKVSPTLHGIVLDENGNVVAECDEQRHAAQICAEHNTPAAVVSLLRRVRIYLKPSEATETLMQLINDIDAALMVAKGV